MNLSRSKFNIKILVLLSTIASTVFLGSFATSQAGLFQGALPKTSFFSFQNDSLLIAASLATAMTGGFVDGEPLKDVSAMKSFYSARADMPFWLDQNGNPGKKAEILIATLHQSWSHGLNPNHYHLSAIQSHTGRSEHEARAKLELLLTDAFIRYAADISGMRVDVTDLNTDPGYWRPALTGTEALALLQKNAFLADVLETFVPASETYKRLRQELIRLVQEENTYGPEPYAGTLPIDFDDVLMRPGLRHFSIPALRTRLGVTEAPSDAQLYDDRLMAAVMRFQREHGLKSDGMIGAMTLQRLNHTRRDKMHQLIANLERLRWARQKDSDRFVIVNIPSATLWAVENGQVAFEMPVVVGKPERQTNSFVTDIVGIRFNPDWTVPPTIKRQDIWPKLKEDPNYLANKGIELYDGYDPQAPAIDPAAIDWASMRPSDLHRLRMVQIPGAQNPLGFFRVLMPNKYNIYLHDTNHRELFDGANRAQSSGCIRLKDPEKMARFILEGETEWSRAEAALARGRKTDHRIAQTIPVYLYYYTSWIDPQGSIVYGNDIYDLDRKLIEKLSAIDGFYIPMHNEGVTAPLIDARLVSL